MSTLVTLIIIIIIIIIIIYNRDRCRTTSNVLSACFTVAVMDKICHNIAELTDDASVTNNVDFNIMEDLCSPGKICIEDDHSRNNTEEHNTDTVTRVKLVAHL